MTLLIGLLYILFLSSTSALAAGDTTVQSVQQAIAICGTPLSEARQLVLANQLVRIESVYFTRETDKQAFLGLLCIESQFNPAATSRVGAIGISQLMPKYAQAFASECGLGSIEISDLQDAETNLTLGACHFRTLLDALDGNVALALSGYNSGQESKTTQQLGKLVTNSKSQTETLGYVSKFYVYINKLQTPAVAGTTSNKLQGVHK